jgi:hypothetical protein
MSASRNWYFSTVAIAALSLGFDAGAQKPEHLLQKIHDLKPAWAGFPGQSARTSNHSSLPGHGQSSGPLASADRGSSGSKGTISHGGDMPEKSNKGRGHGKYKHGSPDESVQAYAGEANPQGRPWREIPTCQ